MRLNSGPMDVEDLLHPMEGECDGEREEVYTAGNKHVEGQGALEQRRQGSVREATSPIVAVKKGDTIAQCPMEKTKGRGKKGVCGAEDDWEDAGGGTAQDLGGLELCAVAEASGVSGGRNGADTWDDLSLGLVNNDKVAPWAMHLDPMSGSDPRVGRIRKERPHRECVWRTAATRANDMGASFRRFRVAILPRDPRSVEGKQLPAGASGARPPHTPPRGAVDE